MMTVRRAVPADVPTVVELLRSVADWLHSEGHDQWPVSSPTLGPARIGAQVDRGEFWVVSDETGPAATIAISRQGDPDFWTPGELAEPAAYFSKAAVVRRRAGEGLGALVLRWAVDHAAADGARWARLDAWRTNEGLHAYYRARGWTWLRTVDAPRRKSGALFQRPAAADPAAQAAFTERPSHDVTEGGYFGLEPGAPVIVAAPGGPVAATVADVMGPDWGHAVVGQGWEYGASRPPITYTVTRRGEDWHAAEGAVWPDPARPATAR